MISDIAIGKAIENMWDDDDNGDFLGWREGSEDDLIYNLENDELLVYFIRAGTFGPIKIGQSHNPIKRITALQTAIPDTLILMGTVLHSIFTEEDLHIMFNKYRIKREWFLPANKLINFIKKHRLTQKDIISQSSKELLKKKKQDTCPLCGA